MNHKKWSLRKLLRTIWVSVGVLFTGWLIYSYQSHGVNKTLLHSNQNIKVEDADSYYQFIPQKEYRKVFIFYPGAMVDPKAYVPLCREIAENQIKVYLIKMPFRLASKGYNKPKELGLFQDKSKAYILAGHSQGAKMAAQFVYENLGTIHKLILIGTSHPRDISLTGCTIPVLKIYGSNDGVSDSNTIMNNKAKLPETTRFVCINGANHSQFGYYGFQFGDNLATISREQQQKETIEEIIEFVNEPTQQLK